jgi:hypothetical protein
MADQRKQKQKQQSFLGIKLVRNTVKLDPNFCRRVHRRCRSMSENLVIRPRVELSFIYSFG